MMGASEVTSETKGWESERLCDFDGGFPKLPLRLRGREVRGCATLMGASKVNSETKGWESERLCDFDGGFP